MINLTTDCRKSDTFSAVVALMLFAAPAISLGQQEEFSKAAQGTEIGVSVLELSGHSEENILSGPTRLVQKPQGKSTAIQPGSIPPGFANENPILQTQQTDDLDAPADGLELDAPQVLLRGPLHEAFADVHQADPQPNPIVNAVPPETIKEVPPEFKPEGNNVAWIPGYWAWDESQNDFIWISGVWRDVPPNQRWMPGYWEQAENGHRWIAGFWTSVEQQELSYLPTPPANLDRGPSVAAPSDDYFYCPGNWEHQNNSYVWRTGHWQPRVANWMWIPASYVWTPNGCVYRAGYWDRDFDVRGTLFAPIHFQNQQYLASNFSFQPNHCVNTGADFFVHLFVRSNCNSYFYGDWYGQNFANTGFRPWVQPQSHVRNYDPLLAHYNCSRYRQGNQLLINWVNIQHQHYRRNQNYRPRNTLQSHVNFANSNHNQLNRDFINRALLANRYDDIVRGRSNGQNVRSNNNRNQRHDNPNFKRSYVRTDRHDHDRHNANKHIQRETKNNRKLAEQLAKNSDRNAARLAKNTPRHNAGKDKNNRDRDRASELTRAQIEKAQRDQAKAIRKRELEQKIAATKQQAEIKRQQRDIARELSDRQRKQKLEQTRQRLAQEKQDRESKRNQDPSRNKRRIEQPHLPTSAFQNSQNRIEEQRRKQQLSEQKSNRAGSPNRSEQNGRNTQQLTSRQKADLAKQQREIAKQQRDAKNRLAAERAKQSAQQKSAQAREASRLRDLKRQQDKAARLQADARKRLELQAKLAREKSQRDEARRAAQQRSQQKAQADAQRRALEKSQRDAQRKAADQARRAAKESQKRQRDKEQAERRAKRKKK